MKREITIGIGFIMLWLAAAGAVLAQAYPARPVRMIVPVPPGGSVDVVARIVGQKMSELMGQNVVKESGMRAD